MRRTDREITDPEEIRKILAQAKILHLGLIDGDFPYIVPLHFGYEYADGKPVFYVHCAKEGHKLDLIRANPHICVETECPAELISGGDNPCGYGAYYQSFIGRGCAEIVCTAEEKIRGLSLLMQHQTGRNFVFDAQAVSTVSVIRITVSEWTAKARRP